MRKRGNLVIRADAGEFLGTGHVMRMIALAQAWKDGGGQVLFACATCPPGVLSRLEKEGFDVCMKSVELGNSEDLNWTQEVSLSASAEWVVLDGYHFGEFFQRELRKRGLRVMVLDDCGHCDTWHAQAVLNGNLHADRSAYAGSINDSGVTFLHGPKFALLRREFQSTPVRMDLEEDSRPRILVTFGGVDPSGAALRIVKALAPVVSVMSLRVRVLIGQANSRASELTEFAASHSHWIEAKSAVSDMPAEYAWADRIISAGGSSCLEWLRYRKAGWVVSIAENQHPIVAAISSQNLAHNGGRIEDYPDDLYLSNVLQEWLRGQAQTPAAIVDAWGAARVAAWLDGSMLFVRPVDPHNDSEVRFLFELSNEASVRNAGFHNDPIPWAIHVDWVRRHSESLASLLLCGEHLELGLCAFVRFHQRTEIDWEVGIALTPTSRGRGIARPLLERGIQLLRSRNPGIRLLAVVKMGNEASVALFRSLSFCQIASPNTTDCLMFSQP
jgi:UDP-2,4-diacetamido-2,4,6-trideoxy-beta-L-altropyranose hydrolase